MPDKADSGNSESTSGHPQNEGIAGENPAVEPAVAQGSSPDQGPRGKSPAPPVELQHMLFGGDPIVAGQPVQPAALQNADEGSTELGSRTEPPSQPTPTSSARQPETSPTQSTSQRRFLGLGKPILRATAEQLFHQYHQANAWDLREQIIVLPSSQACRRLSELLAIYAQEKEVVYYPPQIVTIGALPELLYVAKQPFASQMVQHLAWKEVLQATPASELSHLIPVPPSDANSMQWLELGRTVGSLHCDLAADGHTFKAVVHSLKRSHPERKRWEVLSDLQRRYLQCLDQHGLWDIQTARLYAIDYHEPETEKQVLVVACVDLNQTQRSFLEAISHRVQVWIAAEETQANHFDAWGCLVTEHWQNETLDIPSEQIFVGNSTSDQSSLAASCTASLGNEYHLRDVTIGVPDKSLIPQIKQQFDLAGIPARHGAGNPIAQSEPLTLLSLLGKYIEDRSFTSFAALIRHPAVSNLVRISKTDVAENWLTEIDAYYQESLPKQVDGFINDSAPGAETFQKVAQTVDRWLAKLGKRTQRISAFVQPLLSVFTTAYQRIECDLEDPIDGPLYTAARKLTAKILEIRDIPDALEPKVTAAELIDFLTNSLKGELIPEVPNPASVELLGWLELAFDDTPVLILTGMHDGVVPESVNADAFLPNSLRRQLGMVDNDRRYARDMYYLKVIQASRAEVRYVVGKVDAAGDPLSPSRLLMACPLERLPARVLHLVDDELTDVLPNVQSRWDRTRTDTRLTVPIPSAAGSSSQSSGRTDIFGLIRPPKHITVTAFRDYLACPYRFYLRHVRKLRSEDDQPSEMGARQFGNLVHDTLALLEGPIAASTDPLAIQTFLLEELHKLAKALYGPHPAAPVLIQIEQAELRLSIFAERQAEHAAQGWEIKFVEKGVDAKDLLLLGRDKQLPLVGRIDRIDFNRETGEWAIWDYKTSESAKNPVSVHWTKRLGWRDLQLPLYRHIAARMGVTGEPQLGYIALPKQASDIGFHPAAFSDEQIDAADELAQDIAHRVANCEFWPEEIEEVAFDDYARICQVNTRRVTVAAPTPTLQRTREDEIGSTPEETAKSAQRLLDQPIVTRPDLPPLLIRASAGTGKTFQLSNRLLQIVLAGQDVDGILATTFTRKAAGEILSRVLGRLARACLDEKARSVLEEHLKGVDTSAANCLATLRRLTAAIHRLRISTLDSFFAQVARAFTFELALPQGWSAMDPVQEPAVQLQSIANMLDSHDRQTLVNLVRMLAKGESSRRVADEIRRTVSAGYDAFRITKEKHWDQLQCPESPSEQAVNSALMTLESTTLNHKSADPQLKKLHHEAEIGDWEKVIGHGIYERLQDSEPSYYGRELPPSLVRALELLSERAAAELLPVRRHQTKASYSVLKAYDQEYSALVRKYRMLAFADVTFHLAQWLGSPQSATTSQTAQQLAFRLDCGIHHLLLDEFQDTSPEQWRILRPLAQPLAIADDDLEEAHRGAWIEADKAPHRSIFCVGDTKQAIYGWRGGVAEVFDSVTKSIPNIEQQELKQSYRSSPEVMDVVNSVFQHLPQHKSFGQSEAVAVDWSKRFPKHQTALDSVPGYVCLQNGPKLDRELLPAEKRQIFLQYSAQQIAQLVEESNASVGVLLRTNNDVAQMISILRDLGVSASQDGGNPMTDSTAVELVLSLIHLADHPGDKICLFHVATSPLAAALPFMSDAIEQRDATQLAEWFRGQVTRRGLGDVLEWIAGKLADQLSWWDLHRLEQLIQVAHESRFAHGGRLREFEELVEAKRVSLPSEAQVQVMTIHRSKGLEYDAVFLPELGVELSDGTSLLVLRGEDPCEPPDGVLRYMNASLQAMLPQSWQDAFQQNRDRALRESLCLLYVAMTRARHALYMVGHPHSRSVQEFDSILQSTLSDKAKAKEAESLLFEKGDPHWYRPSFSKRPQASEASDGQTAAPMKIQVQTDPVSAPQRGLRVTAASFLSHYSEPKPLVEAFSYSQSVGTTYGKLIHRCFEQIEWLGSEPPLPRKKLKQLALSSITPEELQTVSLDRALDDFDDMLQLGSVRAALSRNRYRNAVAGQTPDAIDVDNERQLSVVIDGQHVVGKIDRLVVLKKNGIPYAAEIIDFKTDSFDPNMTLLWLDDRIEHHRLQLEAYATVVARLFRIPRQNISAYLVMLATDDFVKVPLRGLPPPRKLPRQPSDNQSSQMPSPHYALTEPSSDPPVELQQTEPD